MDVASLVLKKHGFKDLNPLQEKALPYLLSDNNVLIVAPTASGKTLLGEIAMIKEALEGKKAIYLTPLRALATEKYRYFKTREPEFSVGISTGDYQTRGEYLKDYDLIVLTYERYDSIIRHSPDWLSEVGVVVIDEIHTINDPKRGPVVEMIIARSSSRIVGLSATIGNPEDLSDRLEAELIYSDRRPVPLHQGVFYKKRIYWEDGEEEYISSKHRNPTAAIVERTLSQSGQVLIFRPSRGMAERTARSLSKIVEAFLDDSEKRELRLRARELSELESRVEYERLSELIPRGIAYHHAGLSSKSRELIEDLYRERLLKVVVATPTLAAGVNLPARTVIPFLKRYSSILGYSDRIPVSEYKQMTGRAGRPGLDPYGEVIVIANNRRDIDEIFEGYIHGEPEDVISSLASAKPMRVYSLVAIYEGYRDEESIKRLFSRTLAAYYHSDFLENIVDSLDLLERYGMIERGEKISITRLGALTVRYYLDPESVYIALRYLISSEPKHEYAYLHLLYFLPDMEYSMREAEYYSYDTFVSEEDFGYARYTEANTFASMLLDRINEKPMDEIFERYKIYPGDMAMISRTAEWILYSLSKISSLLGLEHSKILEELSIRVKYGIRRELIELVKLPGIGRVRARILRSYGISSIKDIVERGPEFLERLPGFGKKLAERVYQEALNSLGKL